MSWHVLPWPHSQSGDHHSRYVALKPPVRSRPPRTRGPHVSRSGPAGEPVLKEQFGVRAGRPRALLSPLVLSASTCQAGKVVLLSEWESIVQSRREASDERQVAAG